MLLAFAVSGCCEPFEPRVNVTSAQIIDAAVAAGALDRGDVKAIEMPGNLPAEIVEVCGPQPHLRVGQMKGKSDLEWFTIEVATAGDGDRICWVHINAPAANAKALPTMQDVAETISPDWPRLRDIVVEEMMESWKLFDSHDRGRRGSRGKVRFVLWGIAPHLYDIVFLIKQV